MIFVEQVNDVIIYCVSNPLDYKTTCEVTNSSGTIKTEEFIYSSKEDRYMKIKRLANRYRRKYENCEM